MHLPSEGFYTKSVPPVCGSGEGFVLPVHSRAEGILAKRLAEAKGYKFEKIKQARLAAQAQQPEVPLIDLSIGEPLALPPAEVIAALKLEASVPGNHLYADNGCLQFQKAVAEHLQAVYGVTVDPCSEVLHTMGIKAALPILAAALINPGDVVLTTAPGYPVFSTHTHYYGGVTYTLPLLPENQFLPDLEAVPKELWPKVKVLLLNYPNNPTGAVATETFFAQAVAYAQRYQFVIIQDAAYAALVHSSRPLSILSIPGAKAHALELHSFSKTFNMMGWRIGWVCGDAALVQAYGRAKSNFDSGQFLAIQKAACVALKHSSFIAASAQTYRRRLVDLQAALTDLGFAVHLPAAGFYLYVKAPTAMIDSSGAEAAFESAEAFSEWLLRRCLVSTVPWDDAGSWVRFSVTYAAATPAAERQLVGALMDRLKPYTFL